VWLLLLGLALAGGAVEGARGPALSSGRVEFQLTDLEGRTVSTSDPDLAGKVLLIDLWGTWCPPCLTSIPTFVELQERYGAEGLQVLGLAFERTEGEARPEGLRRAVAKYGINYPVLLGGSPGDVTGVFPDLEGFGGFPVEILVGRDGRVRAVRNGYGYKKKWARRLDEEIRELLAEPVPGAGEVPGD
jgi:thiol-disulfide isomerase/thioredoxin